MSLASCVPDAELIEQFRIALESVGLSYAGLGVLVGLFAGVLLGCYGTQVYETYLFRRWKREQAR